MCTKKQPDKSLRPRVRVDGADTIEAADVAEVV